MDPFTQVLQLVSDFWIAVFPGSTRSGFCGSLTTFSSWQMEIFDAWVNAKRYQRGGLRDVSRVSHTYAGAHSCSY